MKMELEFFENLQYYSERCVLDGWMDGCPLLSVGVQERKPSVQSKCPDSIVLHYLISQVVSTGLLEQCEV